MDVGDYAHVDCFFICIPPAGVSSLANDLQVTPSVAINNNRAAEVLFAVNCVRLCSY